MATAEEIYGRDIAFKGDFIASAAGDIETIAGVENVKDAILRRLVTQPGSLVHRPNYGVGVKDFQNRLNSISTQRELAQRISEQLPQDPRVEKVVGMRVESEDMSPELVKIILRVQLVGYGEQTLAFTPFEGA